MGCPLSKREHFFPLRSKAKSVMHCFFSLRANYILSFGHEPIWAIYVLVSLSFSGYCTNGHKDFYSIATGCLYPLYIWCMCNVSSIFFSVKTQCSQKFMWPFLWSFRPFNWYILLKSINWRILGQKKSPHELLWMLLFDEKLSLLCIFYAYTIVSIYKTILI